jgi:hypothetical protein
MARFLGRAAAIGRRIPSMECALVCLLLILSLIGSSTHIDNTMRAAASGAIASLYYGETVPAVHGVPIPKTAIARAQTRQPFGSVQAQAGRNP